MTESKDARVPKNITHYSVGERIGGGGMGVVYRGRDRRDDSPVAVKLLHPHLAEDESFRERFEREAHVGALLRSPYVVRLLDYGFAEGRYFIVMEFVGGQSLKEAIAAGPITAARALRIGAQTARALEEAEARGIVHRDIKPDNILLGPGDATKVADFGIAKQLSSGTLTMPGAFVGTLFYAAPELALGRADNRSDVYSLGATLFHAVTGHPPFRGDALEVLRQHAEKAVPLEDMEALPESLREIIIKCLRKDADERYQSCSDLAGDLEKALTRLGQAAEDAPTVVADEPEEPKPEELTAATQVVPPATPPVTSEPAATAPTEAAPTPAKEGPQKPAPAPPLEERPEPAVAADRRTAGRPPPSRKRGIPSWIPAALVGVVVAVAAAGALVALGSLGGDDNGGDGGQEELIGRDGLSRMLPRQFELGPAYSAFQLNPDVSGYVTSSGLLGVACPAETATGATTPTPRPLPIESYDNQYEFEPSLASESGTFALVEGVDKFADRAAATDALDEFIAGPADHIAMGGCPENEVVSSEAFEPEGVGGDATGVEQLIRQTDGDTVREFTVTAVGFTHETVLGRVLIAHFDSPQHRLSAAQIAASMDIRIAQVLAELAATPTPTETESGRPSGSATPSGSPDGSATASPKTSGPTKTAAPGQPPAVQSLGCSPSSLNTGQTVSCSPSLSGSVTSRSWSASGGSPSSGSGSTFSTAFSSAGSKTITLEACNSSGCDSSSQVIFVSAPATQAPTLPVINSLGCSPTTVTTGQKVSCSPSVSGSVTSYGWSASGGSPSEGTGSTFSTSFSSTGTKFIGFAVCNNAGCTEGKTQAITVTAPAVGEYTVYTEHVSLYSDETVDVTVFIETPSSGLGEYDIDLIYDPQIIEPVGCIDWVGGDCDEFFDIDIVNSYGYAGQSGNFAVFTVTFAVVGCCYSDLFVSVFDMYTIDDTPVDDPVEIHGSVTVDLFSFRAPLR